MTYQDTINENNPALEQGIRIAFPAGFICDMEKLRPFLLSLSPYYAATLHPGTARLTITCVNDIERDPINKFSDMLYVLGYRKDEFSALLEVHGLPEAEVTLYFSHNHYGTFAIRSSEKIYSDDLLQTELSRVYE